MCSAGTEINMDKISNRVIILYHKNVFL